MSRPSRAHESTGPALSQSIPGYLLIISEGTLAHWVFSVSCFFFIARCSPSFPIDGSELMEGMGC